jgi:hypothetical protein
VRWSPRAGATVGVWSTTVTGLTDSPDLETMQRDRRCGHVTRQVGLDDPRWCSHGRGGSMGRRVQPSSRPTPRSSSLCGPSMTLTIAASLRTVAPRKPSSGASWAIPRRKANEPCGLGACGLHRAHVCPGRGVYGLPHLAEYSLLIGVKLKD